MTLSNGCGESNHDHGHAHEESPKTAQITVWTDRYEIFAEHQAPVAGRPTTLITHVTDLETREPRHEGMVTFILRQGDVVVEHPQATPAQAGIYLPDLRFPQPGDWQLTLHIPTDGASAPVDLGTIQVYADEHAAAHAEFPDAPEGVTFLKEQQWKILCQTEPASERLLVERVKLPARVRPKPGFSATVVAPVSGQMIDIPQHALPQPGERVEEGQLLAVLKPNFSETAAILAEADADFEVAKAALDQAEAAYARTKALAAKEAKSERELEEAELAYHSARARYAAAAGLIQTFRQSEQAASTDSPLVLEIRAPIGGIVDAVLAGPGEVIASGQSVFTLLNPENIWIEGHVPEASVSRLAKAGDAVIETPGDAGRFVPIVGEGRGRLIALGLRIDETTRTAPLIYETANQDGALRIGQHVMLHVETERAEKALAIPESALVEEGGQKIAYVQLSGETFEKREVKTGIEDAGFVQVLAGIRAGERVVTQGAYAIRLSSISGVIPAHGHAH